MKDRRLSCPHLHRDLAPPQHAGLQCVKGRWTPCYIIDVWCPGAVELDGHTVKKKIDIFYGFFQFSVILKYTK